MKSRSDGTILIAIYHFISGFLSLFGMWASSACPFSSAGGRFQR